MKLSVSEMAGVLVEFGDLIPLPNGFYDTLLMKPMSKVILRISCRI
jgi:hypothetical protein